MAKYLITYLGVNKTELGREISSHDKYAVAIEGILDVKDTLIMITDDQKNVLFVAGINSVIVEKIG